MVENFAGIAGVAIVGMLLATIIYVTTQAIGSDDPFAIELIFWWVLADGVLISGLRGWALCFSSEFVRSNGQWIGTGLAMGGTVLGLVALMFSLRQRNHYGQLGRYVVWASPEDSWFVPKFSRRFLARGLASGFSAAHLAIFFA